VLSDDRFLYDNLDHFWYHEGDLYLDCLYFCLVYLYFLILDTISVGWDLNLSEQLDWNSSLNLYLYNFFSLYDLFNDFLDLNCLDFFLVYDDRFLNYDLSWFFDLFDDHLRNHDFNYLQQRLLYNHYFLYNFRHLYDLFDYPWHHYDFLYYFFNLDYSGHLDYLFNNPINHLLLDSNDFFFNYNRNRFFNFNRFDDLLSNWHQSNLLNLQFLDFLSEIRHRNFSYNWNLFSYV